MPFRKKLPKMCPKGTDKYTAYDVIKSSMQKSSKKAFAIDDSQYLMAFDSFARAKETGYGKFTDMAVNFKNLISFVIDELSEDVIVYFLHHVETSESGKIKAKTIGKMLDSQLTVEGLFSIVLLCIADRDTHKFVTQSDGYSTAKSPGDWNENDKFVPLFEKEISNDLKFVDTEIRKYWDLKIPVKIESEK